MKLIDDWKRKFPRLWSIRLALLAGIVSGLDAGYQTWITGQTPIVTAISTLLALAAAAARVIAQPSVSDHGSEP